MGSVYENALRVNAEVVASQDSVTPPEKRCERP